MPYECRKVGKGGSGRVNQLWIGWVLDVMVCDVEKMLIDLSPPRSEGVLFAEVDPADDSFFYAEI